MYTTNQRAVSVAGRRSNSLPGQETRVVAARTEWRKDRALALIGTWVGNVAEM